MKALDFIKEVELFYSMDKHDAKKCNEAIKELEELENRSCDSCIYVGKSNCINCLSCKRQYSDNWRNK